MLTRRIIPCLDIKEGRVVKGTNFLNLCDAGDPLDLAQRYNSQSADELVFLDINASKENRKITINLAKRLARELFIPFTIGGGINLLNEIHVIMILLFITSSIKLSSTPAFPICIHFN